MLSCIMRFFKISSFKIVRKKLRGFGLTMGPSVVGTLKLFDPSKFTAFHCLGMSSKCLILFSLTDAEIIKNDKWFKKNYRFVFRT